MVQRLLSTEVEKIMKLCGKFCRTFAYTGVVAGLLTTAMAAQADTVTATFELPANAGTTGTVAGSTIPGINGNDYYASIYNFVDATSPGGSLGLPASGTSGEFQGVCVDFSHEITNGETVTWNVSSLGAIYDESPPTINGITDLTHTQVNALGYLYATLPPDLSSLDPDQKTQFQMAVWDVIYPGTTYAGDVAGSNGAFAQSDADAAVAWANTNFPSSYMGEGVTVLIDGFQTSNPGNLSQDFAVAFVNGTFGGTPPRPTPLPAAFGSGLAGLGVLSLVLLKRRAKAAC
jgi:hypothetical protein